MYPPIIATKFFTPPKRLTKPDIRSTTYKIGVAKLLNVSSFNEHINIIILNL